MPRRAKLGQHFLADATYRHKIVDSIEVRPADWVVEVGAGRGELTELLARRAAQVIAIELDGSLVARLRQKFEDQGQVTVVAANFLEVDLAGLVEKAPNCKCLVFGNLPYYITSPILHHLFDAREAIQAMALLMQREVAERVIAKPGRRDYGYLSVLAQLFSHPSIAFNIPPGAFSPSPKVQSSLVKFQMVSMFPDWTEEQTNHFLRFVKACFSKKRKSLENNLKALYPRARLRAACDRLGLAATVRAEGISLVEFPELFKILEGN